MHWNLRELKLLASVNKTTQTPAQGDSIKRRPVYYHMIITVLFLVYQKMLTVIEECWMIVTPTCPPSSTTTVGVWPS